MTTREMLTLCFALMIIVGINLNFVFYQNIVPPLYMSMDHLDGVIGSSDPELIRTHLAGLKQELKSIMQSLPEGKNPVWFYPTESTNFLRIESDVNTMITSVEKISAFPKDTLAYHTGIMDISSRASLIKENLSDARGFLYASATNVVFTLIWLAGAMGFAKIWIRE